jgi:hypothetical protein
MSAPGKYQATLQWAEAVFDRRGQKMMLWDDGECWKFLRFIKLLKSMGMDLVLVPGDKK